MSEYKEILNAIIDMRTEINNRFDKVEARLARLEEGQRTLEVSLEDVQGSINELIKRSVQSKEELRSVR